MKSLIFIAGIFVLTGCQAFTVEMDKDWTGDATDPSDVSVVIDIDTSDTTDEAEPDDASEETEPDEPSEETEPDEPSDPSVLDEPSDETMPDDPSTPNDDCIFIDCSTDMSMCANPDPLVDECCGSCIENTLGCHPYIAPYNYREILRCENGCWLTDSSCEFDYYCKTQTDDSPICNPLPHEQDGICDSSEFYFSDQDCNACDACPVENDSFCSRASLSPDTLLRCVDYYGHGVKCWEWQECGSESSGQCIEDLAKNYAACAPFPENFESFCDAFECTGAQMCDPFDGTAGGGVSDCGYCGKCCEPDNGSLCGYSWQQEPAILYPTNDNLCFAAETCNSSGDQPLRHCRFLEGAPECVDVDWSN